MLSAAVALKIAVPVLLAGGGLVALATVPQAAPDQAAQLWIDSPGDGARIDPGAVTVVAHAADGADLDDMTLVVDGAALAKRSNLTRYDRLAGVQFSWNATAGYHFLVVSGNGRTSARVAVLVGPRSALGTPDRSTPASPTRSPSPTATPPSPTASPTVPPTATPTATPTARPTSTPAPPRDPVLGAVTVTPSRVGPDTPSCTGPIVVRASARGATAGNAHVTTSGFDKNIGGAVRNGVFSVSFNQRDLTGSNTSGSFRVEVTVTNSVGFDAGAASLSISCSKD